MFPQMDPIFTMSSSWLCLAKQDRSGGTVREDLLRYVERGDFIDRSGVWTERCVSNEGFHKLVMLIQLILVIYD